MARKKSSAQKKIQPNNNWTPSWFGGRYIFFNTLSDSEKKIATHFNSAIKPDKGDKNYEKYLNYITTYISTLEELAAREQSNELKYLSSLKKIQIPIETYQTGGRFDYIHFIRDLNQAHGIAEDLLKNIIQTNKTNFNDINKLINPTKEQLTSEQLLDIGDELREKITHDYLFAYSKYTDTMQELMQSQLQESFSEAVNKKLQEIFKNLGNNTDLISMLVTNLKSIDPNIDPTTAVQNWCVEFLRQELIDNSQDISKVVFDPSKIDDTKAQSIFNNSLDRTYANVMSTIKNDVEKILDSAFNRNENLANMINSENSPLNELLDVINASTDSRNEIQNALTQMVTRITEIKSEKAQTEEAVKTQIRKISAAKGKFTKTLGNLIRQQIVGSSKGMDKQSRNKLIKKIMSKYENSLDLSLETIAERIGKKIKVTATSGSSIAEILASPDFLLQISNSIQNIYTPGKEIQFKADLTFNVNAQELNGSDLTSVWKEGDVSFDLAEAKEIAENKGKLFLQEYKKLANGHTSVEKAEEAYLNTMKKAIRYERAVLNQTEENLHDLIKNYFSNGLDGSISVKDYHFYNNTQGYHMGSMGGGGKVVDAIPNIMKMLELGGISFGDTEVIIQALLNCFPDSLIGTSILDDIKSLLIGGAAMMLFDDGFANAEAFLQRMKEELSVNNTAELPTGGSLHLLYLNNIYVPQSYVLYNIIANLKKVYQDIYTQTSQDPIMANTKSQLVLNNPMNLSILNQIEEDGQYPTRASKWNAISAYAQENTTIHFLFMAGMLDLMQELESSFDVKK